LSKIDVFQPSQRQRIAPSAGIDIIFALNYFSSASITQAAISFKVAENKDFSGTVTNITPTSLSVYNGSAYVAYTGVSIKAADLGKKFKYTTASLTDSNKILYLKIIITEGTDIYESGTILLTALNKIDFTLSNPKVLNVMPVKVKITDKKTVVGTGITYSVQVCNNALDASPTWEDMTTAYLNGDFYTFKNAIKTAGSWGINVRYIVTKTNYNSTVEINEIYLAHI
jgi:hypothetical protein